MTDTPPMMKCGHAANGARRNRDGSWTPCCVICAGIPGLDALTVDESPPDFTGRTARCGYYGVTPKPRRGMREGPCGTGECVCEEPSSPGLAFFEHQPDKPHDLFYCGCWGWD